MSAVPYTVILLEEALEGPEFFREVAKPAILSVSPRDAVREATDIFTSLNPRVQVVGILRGNFAGNWVPASLLRESAL